MLDLVPTACAEVLNLDNLRVKYLETLSKLRSSSKFLPFSFLFFSRKKNKAKDAAILYHLILPPNSFFLSEIKLNEDIYIFTVPTSG